MSTQVPLAIGSKDRNVAWYDPPLTSVEGPIRDLLENYSHVPADEVVSRVVEMRDKLWDVHPWPCVGQFRFTALSLRTQPSYPHILSRLQSSPTTERLLDVGCCLAPDLRKLAHDGAPSSCLVGLDTQAEFITLGYDFFNDRETFKGRFIHADILDTTNEEVKNLEGGFGVVLLGMVLHIWDLEGQIRACERVVQMLRPERGVMVVGQSVGSLVATEVVVREGGKGIYKHDVESFGRMWEEVGRRTGTKWEVRARLDEGLGIAQGRRGWDEPSTRRLFFEVERV
ncbi:hypothetical protein B0T19DRAFT_274575 [Cercophora scortea]|uniref:Methyltransferase domain-containing protein n=1 Tax=Cercophora scortea TaxID=314031 RepID=A0AAE0I7V8_9PEZI|nr:hypothetical protein B0T19DRAFT_274575 [Cercophora scortea]